MRRAVLLLLVCPLLAASALAQPVAEPLDNQLRRARAEEAAAEAEAARLEKAASQAKGQADRLHAEQVAAAQAIEAAEARIIAADVRVRLASAYVDQHRRQLAEQQRPASSLLAGLAIMGRRPPLLAIADRGSTDQLVAVRILLDSTLPVIRQRTARLSSQLGEGRQLEQSAIAARTELDRSRQQLVARRQQFAALEQKSIERSLASSGQALSASDVAIASGESVERLRGQLSGNRSALSLVQALASEPPPPARPFAPQGSPAGVQFAYQLPVTAPVVEGLAAVNDSGVRSRGLTFASSRGTAVSAPAGGFVRFAGPFRDYDGVMIIDHGGGWSTLLVNIVTSLRPGDKVQLGDPIGRALGPLQVELSHNGQRVSPALIAGSSASLSNVRKGG